MLDDSSENVAPAAPAEAKSNPVPCPVEFTVRLIGGKWKLLVLRALLFHTRLRYNELLGKIRGLSPKELTRNLRELEEVGLVQHEGSAAEQHVEYSLTAVGSELMPAFNSLAPVGQKLMQALGPDRECEER
jgi:DNA-binding HxlR family transcriptional regulator